MPQVNGEIHSEVIYSSVAANQETGQGWTCVWEHGESPGCPGASASSFLLLFYGSQFCCLKKEAESDFSNFLMSVV